MQSCSMRPAEPLLPSCAPSTSGRNIHQAPSTPQIRQQRVRRAQRSHRLHAVSTDVCPFSRPEGTSWDLKTIPCYCKSDEGDSSARMFTLYVPQEEVDLDVSVDKGLQKLIDTRGAGVISDQSELVDSAWATLGRQIGMRWPMEGLMLSVAPGAQMQQAKLTECCLSGRPCGRCKGRGYTRAARGRSLQSPVQVDGRERASIFAAHR